MNAGDLWPGNDYAYYRYIGHDKYHSQAKRVRVVRVTKRTEGYNSKATTYVDVWMIDEETEEPINDNETREVRARDIFARWEDFQDERDRLQAEKQRQMREQEERYARQRQEQEERVAREQAQRDRLLNALEARGIKRKTITIGAYRVEINREELEAWLGLDGV